MNESIRPVGRRLLIEMEPVEEKVGSIVIASQQTEREQLGQSRGKVLEIGDMCWRDLYKDLDVPFSPWCKVGDRIVFQSFAGAKPTKDKKDLKILINDLDVMGVIENE